MLSALFRKVAVVLALVGSVFALDVASAAGPAQQVEALLNRVEGDVDFAEAKLAIDAVVDPAIDLRSAHAQIDALTDAARAIAGPNPTSAQKIAALRNVIYEPGPWNDYRPFQYDNDDPLGQKLENQLLSTYLKSRKGNCVSMPALFLILADRLGADVTLATAPLHIFVKYTDEAGRVINLETTSGANPARDAWIIEQMPMTKEAIARGVYMRALTRREAAAHLAGVIVDHQIREGDYFGAIETADAILKANSKDVYAIVKKGTAYGHLLRTRFFEKYPAPDQIPQEDFEDYQLYSTMNARLFELAASLGWRPANDAYNKK